MSKNISINDIIEQDIANNPVFLVANVEIPLEQILDKFAPELFTFPEIPGICIKGNDNHLIGFIPREKILELISTFNARDNIELAGIPHKRPIYLSCPKKGCKYKELIIFYDPEYPAKCPHDGSTLRRVR